MLPYVPIPILVLFNAVLLVLIIAVVAALRDTSYQTRSTVPEATFRVLISESQGPEDPWCWYIVDPTDGAGHRPFASGKEWSPEAAQRAAFDSFSRWAQRHPQLARYSLAFPDGTVECI